MKSLLVAVILALLLPSVAIAQSTYGQRVASMDGKMLLPVASNMLGSNEQDHLNRGSVNAWDVSAAIGTPVFPIAGGVIEYAGCNNAGGYGCWLFINHGGVKAIYAHCLENSLLVRNGAQVTQWTQVCNVGMTGKTSWPHVHLEIHKLGGGRYRIGDLFDIRQMYYCKFCKSGNVPDQKITGIAYRATPQAAQMPSLSYLWLIVPFALLSGLYLLSGYSRWMQHAIYHGMAMYVCVLFFWVLGGTLPSSGVRVNASSSADGWQTAYALTIGSEGASCTHDPVRTAGGVTQGTYDAWRMSQGMGYADVCGSLTEAQRQAIFIERYWKASGADKLPSGLALTHVDFAFNAGNGAAKSALALSGGSVKVYNDYRERFYLNARGCSLYCAGWLNRLNRIRKVTE